MAGRDGFTRIEIHRPARAVAAALQPSLSDTSTARASRWEPWTERPLLLQHSDDEISPTHIRATNHERQPSTESRDSDYSAPPRFCVSDFAPPPSPRTREAQDRVRRYLLNETPPIPPELQERLRAVGSTSTGPRSGAYEFRPLLATNAPSATDEGSHQHFRQPLAANPVFREPHEQDVQDQSQPAPFRTNMTPKITEAAVTPDIPDTHHDVPSSKPKQPSMLARKTAFWAVITALCITGFLSALDATILSTALPTIVDDLDGAALYMWAVNAYFLSSTVLRPVYAQVANIFSHRWLMLLAITLFAIGSAISGAAVDMPMLVAGRAIQGLGGGGLTVLLNAIVSHMVSPDSRGKFMTLVFTTYTIGNGIGPFVGGFIVEHISWRWVFYINLPMAGVSWILLLVFLDTAGQKQAAPSQLRRIDIIGSALFVGTMASFLFALTYGGASHLWSDWQVLVPIILGALGLLLLIAYESSPYCVEPTVPLRLFSNRTSATAFILSFLHSLLTIWVIYFLPVYFQGAQGSTPSWAGAQILPTVLVLVPAASIGGKILTRIGHYRPLQFAGFALLTIGVALFSLLDVNSSTAMWVGFQFVTATGGGLVACGLLPAVQAGLPNEDEAIATASWGYIRNIGTMWGIAIPSALLNNMVVSFADKIGDSNVRVQLLNGNAYGQATAKFLGSLSTTTARQVKIVYAYSLEELWYVAIGIAGIAFILVLFEADIPLRRPSLALTTTEKKSLPNTSPTSGRTTVQRSETYQPGYERVRSGPPLPQPDVDIPPPPPPPPPKGRPPTRDTTPPPSRPPMSRYASTSDLMQASRVVSPVSRPTPQGYRSPTPTRSPRNLGNSWTPLDRRLNRYESSSWTESPGDANGSRRSTEWARRLTRRLEHLPHELEEQLSQLSEWESRRRSEATFNF